ncbi:MAG: M48 family metallopeptidase [Opitutales bacterium]
MSQLEFISATGRKIPVEIRRRKATRHMRVRLGVRNQIVVSLPWHCSGQACQKFIEHHREWLEAQIAAAPEVISVRDWLLRSPRLSVAGRSLPIFIEASTDTQAAYRIDLKAGQVLLQLPAGEDDSAWYSLMRDFAQETLAVRVGVLASERRFPSPGCYGTQVPDIAYSRVSVRDQSSRWGSCSSRKAINLNWRLVLIEPQLQDYVIWHELAHIAEMNHSKRFWSLLEIYDPKRKVHEKALNAVTPAVMRVQKG